MYLNIHSYSIIRNNKAIRDGAVLFEASPEQDSAVFLSSLYRELHLDYRKFFKMDHLSKLGFLASEILLENNIDPTAVNEDVSVILFNRSSSLDIDTIYQGTIDDAANYYPSPSEFVYTLPNIVTGEIAIRNKIYGETAFFISEQFDPCRLYDKVADSFDDTVGKILCGWVEYYRGTYEAVLYLAVKENLPGMPFDAENLAKIYHYHI